MAAEAATGGTTAAIIPAETDATIAAHAVAAKAEDPGPTAVPDKAVATRTVMAAEMVAIAPVRVIRLTPQFAPASATLTKAVAIVTVMGTRTKTRIATRTVIRIKTRIVTRTGTAIRTKTRIATGTGIKTRIVIRTKTEIAGAMDMTVVITDTAATPSMTTPLLTNLGTTKTILIA